MLGVIVNVLAVILGSAVGMCLKKGIPEKASDAVMKVLGLCTIYIGVDGALGGENTIVLIVSMVVGTIIGSLIDIDDKINKLSLLVERKLGGKNKKGTVAEGFMTASLLFCVGAMTIVGSLNSGLRGDHTLIYTKSVLDLISSCMLASSLGIGVMFAALFVFVFQGAIVLLAGVLQTVLSDAAIIAEICCAGSLMIIGLGLNVLGITKLKIANMLPAMAVVPLFCWLSQFLPI